MYDSYDTSTKEGAAGEVIQDTFITMFTIPISFFIFIVGLIIIAMSANDVQYPMQGMLPQVQGMPPQLQGITQNKQDINKQIEDIKKKINFIKNKNKYI